MDIATLKAQLSILTVLEHYGLQPNKNGMLCCPFHADKTPSLQIYPKTNTYCCFSSNCKAGSGDQIQFIELMDKAGKHAAILKAQALLGPVAVTAASGPQLSRIAVLSKFYEGSCHRNETAQAYLAARGLADTLAGYVSEKLGLSWNEKLRQSALSLGLLIQKADGYLAPRFKGCAVFPLKNSEGQVVGIYGRSVSEQQAGSRHYYLPGERQGLYPQYPPADTTTLVLTESVIDAASLGQAQVPYPVLALYGTNGFTSEHGQVIKGLAGLQEVVLFTDGDESGRQATSKLAGQISLLRPGLLVSSVDTPEGEDANSLLQSHEAGVLSHLISQRQRMAAPPVPLTPTIPLTPTPADPVPRFNPSIPQSFSPSVSHLVTTNPQLLVFTSEQLQITVLGGIKLTSLDRLRVTLKLERFSPNGRAVQPLRQSLDLYHADAVEKLAQKTGEELGLSQGQASQALQSLTDELEAYRLGHLESLSPKAPTQAVLSAAQREQALAYLKEPGLMERTLEDLGKTGIVGEETNRSVMFFVFLSRLMAEPLHVMSLGASGTGKTYLQERIAALVPDECKLEITTLSENALYYFGQQELAHKLLLIEDLDGAQEVLYPLRELQSKQKISKTVSLKDTKGHIKTVTFTVQGPVCVAGCTTKDRLYEDNENRALLLHVDASSEQDERIMHYQRRKAAGLIDTRTEGEKRTLFQTINQLLKPMRVVNPYAHRLIIPDSVFKKRRSNAIYLKFIEVITLYHQYGREKKADLFEGDHYLESTLEDIEWANTLLKPLLLAKSDELSGASRRFLESLKVHLQKEAQYGAPPGSFYAKEIRQAFRLPPATLKRYLADLTRYGYLQMSGGSRARGFRYEIRSYEEYGQLQARVHTVLDELLSTLRAEEAQKVVAPKPKRSSPSVKAA